MFVHAKKFFRLHFLPFRQQTITFVSSNSKERDEMNKRDKKISKAAGEFAKRWEGRGYEKGESQLFWTELLTEVFGIESPSTFIRFEEQVKLDATNFIDGHILSTRVMIEQKSLGKDLRAPIVQSDGKKLDPFEQAKRYVTNLPLSEHPRWIVTCNFAEFLVYDMEHPLAEPEQIFLKDLAKEYYRLFFLVETKAQHLTKEMQVSMQAGAIVGKLYDALLKEYKDPTNPESLRSLNVLCVRLVFCLYSEDAGIFGKHDMFHDYLVRYDTMDMRIALIRLFKILNTPIADRDPYLQDDLAAFPYASGGLFEGDIEIPRLNEEIRDLLLRHASLDFDWSEISPTIFGAVFESTLNPETRRSGGMHYTSVENIHKVIDPLFLNDLRQELDDILAEPVLKQRQKRLREYQDRLASLTFLDPACGSGNFLTETYLSLRHLENRAIRALYEGHSMFIGGDDFINPVKVSIYQFHGIEINDFAVTVAATALWISEAQMLAETERIVSHDFEFLPLKDYPNIHEANALRIDWRSLFTPATQVVAVENNIEETTESSENPEIRLPDYIMGNPPFIGFTFMNAEQKKDVASIYPGIKNVDYVSCWFKKACDFTRGTAIETAFVSTNSITQGETVSRMWDSLDVIINFAYPTFTWENEAQDKAHVHCVIIGFSHQSRKKKYLFTGKEIKECDNINAYLLDAPNALIPSRNSAIAEVPKMVYGNKPADGGFLILSKDEYKEIINKEPRAVKWLYTMIGATEFINNKPLLDDKIRYCLWLEGISPSELRALPSVLQRVTSCKENRLKSPAAAIRKFADTPHLFAQRTQPNIPKHDDKGNPLWESGHVMYNLIVPRVSSERRNYIPMGYVTCDIVTNDVVQIIPDASLYHFGVLESSVHMAWMRTVCGRLKSDYRYSKDVVYNNFPWPEVDEEQRARIAQTAQGILDARALYPDSSLADLYDPITMPPELLKAHRENDRAVMSAYGFPATMAESEIVARLFDLYSQLTKQ